VLYLALYPVLIQVENQAASQVVFLVRDPVFHQVFNQFA
jgi:hypothetical protein